MKRALLFLICAPLVFAGYPEFSGGTKLEIERTPEKEYRYLGMLWISPFHATRVLDSTEPQPPVVPSPATHVRDFMSYEMRFGASYGVTPWMDIYGLIPFKWISENSGFKMPNGDTTPLDPGYGNEQSSIGLGDVELASRFYGERPFGVQNMKYTGIIGFTLPLGASPPVPTEELFFGTGSINPLLGFEFQKTFFGGTPLMGSAFFRFPLVANGDGYLASSRVTATVGFQADLPEPLKEFKVFPRFTVYHESPAKWRNILSSNTGRTDFIPSATIRWKPEEANYLLSASFDFPFRVYSVGSHVTAPFAFYLTFTYLPETTT